MTGLENSIVYHNYMRCVAGVRGWIEISKWATPGNKAIHGVMCVYDHVHVCVCKCSKSLTSGGGSTTST